MKIFLSRLALLLFLNLLAFGVSATAQTPTSVYTSLEEKSCKTIRLDRESESSVQSCPGIAGYKLLVEEGDLRSSVTVIAPDGKKHELDYWTVVTSAFSSLGAKAEWRAVKKAGKAVPIALIVRVNASEDPDNPNKITSYLAVAKITRDKICVTDKIKPGATQNAEARRAADSSATRKCLEP
ncbi:MAG: hypothetical protein AB1757_25190 [Acidobacteriota bacterium]